MRRENPDTGGILKIALLAVGGYFLWEYVIAPMMSGTGTGASGQSAIPGVTAGANAVLTQPTTTPAGSSSIPATVRVINASGGSSSAFKVGDTVQVVATGPPNQPVSYTGTLNGVAFAGGVLGNTDSSGHFNWSGTVTAPLIGSITETWSVGGKQVGTISFTVSASGVAGIVQNIPSMTFGGSWKGFQAPMRKGWVN